MLAQETKILNYIDETRSNIELACLRCIYSRVENHYLVCKHPKGPRFFVEVCLNGKVKKWE